MAEGRCGVPEERWFDLLGGRIGAREADALLAHKEGCDACRTAYAQWEAMVGVSPALRPTSQPAAKPLPGTHTSMPSIGTHTSMPSPVPHTAMHSFGPHTAVPSSGQPTELSPVRRRILLRTAGMYAFARRARRMTNSAVASWRRPAIAAVSGLSIAVVVLLALLQPFAQGGTPADSVLSPAAYARIHAPDGVSVLGEPDTVVYESGEPQAVRAGAGFGAGSAGGARETLWINMRTHELFLLMEGLLPSSRTDVQAWARYGSKSANLGLLRFHDSRAHLYASDVSPEEWESVLLTIEPKGGSRTPTSPETVSIPLRAAAED
ncbi:anti-sigma factor [Cohnella sp. JJ-181]|uniref:anti-sigma factor n=1 Tax=Cohnella rhizoplanae TaxID=2974897 RepID=UPI0022FF82EE|nr:anti-sigma factor [Cohnella sp. JJ-181]CAI6056575.1 hypothetical protein COHCIP112018_01700 [Cohnella sp. JJ-181]